MQSSQSNNLNPDYKYSETDFINPLSDFGFKNLFGKEGKAKQNLIVFLNAILHDQLGFERIVDLSFNPTENKALNPDMKSTQFDVHCKTDLGHRIIVEMQNRWEDNFDNRMIYYMVEGVMMQGYHKYGEYVWDYSLDPVVGLAICNFNLPDFKQPVAFFNMREIKTNIKYGDQLNLVFIHLKEFNENPDLCKTELEKIIYSLRNMETIQKTNHNPFSREKGDFYDTIATMSRVSALSPEDQLAYHAWRIHENDRKLHEERIADNSYKSGLEKGMAQGLEKGIAQGLEKGRLEEKWILAKSLFNKNMSLELIAEVTQLPLSELEKMMK